MTLLEVIRACVAFAACFFGTQDPETLRTMGGRYVPDAGVVAWEEIPGYRPPLVCQYYTEGPMAPDWYVRRFLVVALTEFEEEALCEWGPAHAAPHFETWLVECDERWAWGARRVWTDGCLRECRRLAILYSDGWWPRECWWLVDPGDVDRIRTERW